MIQVTITPFQPRDRQMLDDLLFRSYQVHIHLDWHDPNEWLDTQKAALIRLAWQERKLVGALAVSAPLYHTAWIRLAAVHDFTPEQAVMDTLWADVAGDLRQQGVETVSVLISRDWIQPLMAALGFQFDETVITLQRSGQELPLLRPTSFTLREMLPFDLDTVTQIDHSAFNPPWQLARDELQQARRISYVSTVALHNDAIVGYQISTLYRDGAHLARLAVIPQMQGLGLGSTILTDTLRRFFRRGIYTMTVNTQANNHRSQRLYQTFGFKRNGNDLPIWTIRL